MTRFCTHCGQAVPDNCNFCTNCGAPIAASQPQPQYQVNINSQPNPQPQPQYAGPKPKNYLVWSILTTIFCCLPLGIWCIICSSKVNKEWDRGNYVGAKEASSRAKTWIIVSAILGLVANVVYVFSSGLMDQL